MNIDVTKPENYQTRDGREIVAIFENPEGGKGFELLTVIKDDDVLKATYHFVNGVYAKSGFSKLDIIEKPKDMYVAVLESEIEDKCMHEKSIYNNAGVLKHDGLGDYSIYKLVEVEL